jgi:uncharacterized OsmC-like protein
MNMHAKTPAANIINGINLDDVKTLVGEIERDPKKAMTRWHVSTSWQGQTRSRAKVDGYTLGGEKITRSFTVDADEPNELGGSNMFPNPQEYLLAALNACMTVGYVALSSLHGITLEKVEIESEGDLDLRGFFGMDPNVAPGCESIRYTVRIKGNGTNAQFAEIHEKVMATSPNFYHLSKPVKLMPTLVVE